MSQPARFLIWPIETGRLCAHYALLLGQVNFFQEFEVSFHGRRRQFELWPADHAE